jgi:hypothetical protein
MPIHSDLLAGYGNRNEIIINTSPQREIAMVDNMGRLAI